MLVNNSMYYAVRKGIQPGIYNNWKECEKQIKGYKGAKFRKFENIIDAKNFIKNFKETKVIPLNNFFTINILENENKTTPEIINVYTDGSCYGNGCKISYGGSGGFFGESDKRNFSFPIIGNVTNNIAELKAILKVLDILELSIKNKENIVIYTDSEYSIKCFTTYGLKLYKNMWKSNNNKPIPNIYLIKKGYEIVKKNQNIKFIHIDAHTGKQDIHSRSNEHADELARKGMLESIDNSNNLGLNKFKKGKYKNKTINSVFNIDKTYLIWYLNTKPYTKENVFIYILKKFLQNK